MLVVMALLAATAVWAVLAVFLLLACQATVVLVAAAVMVVLADQALMGMRTRPMVLMVVSAALGALKVLAVPVAAPRPLGPVA